MRLGARRREDDHDLIDVGDDDALALSASGRASRQLESGAAGSRRSPRRCWPRRCSSRTRSPTASFSVSAAEATVSRRSEPSARRPAFDFLTRPRSDASTIVPSSRRTRQMPPVPLRTTPCSAAVDDARRCAASSEASLAPESSLSSRIASHHRRVGDAAARSATAESAPTDVAQAEGGDDSTRVLLACRASARKSVSTWPLDVAAPIARPAAGRGDTRRTAAPHVRSRRASRSRRCRSSPSAPSNAAGRPCTAA